jgi:hypothetical protein
MQFGTALSKEKKPLINADEHRWDKNTCPPGYGGRRVIEAQPLAI